MIISRTPFRVSFFGGGSDYRDWYLENGGAVLATNQMSDPPRREDGQDESGPELELAHASDRPASRTSPFLLVYPLDAGRSLQMQIAQAGVRMWWSPPAWPLLQVLSCA